MPTASELITRIAVEGVDQYARDMGKAEQVTDKTAKNMDTAGKQAGGLGTALGGVASIASGFVVGQGISQLGGYLVGAAKGAADDEAATKRLQQAVKNLGGDYEGTLASVDAAITKGQKLAFTDDQIRDSYQSLAAATGNSEEALQRLAAAQDLARGANIPLGQATKLLGKLNEDNVEVFKRMGIVIGENASEADALAAVQAKFGGQAETFAKSTAGQFEQSKIAMAEFQETVGTVILPIITKLVSGMADAAPKVQAIAGSIAELVAGGQPLASLFEGIFGTITGNEPVLAGIATTVGLIAVGITASLVPAIIAWTTATVAQTAAQIAAGAALIAANAPLILIAVSIGLLVAGIVLLVKHWDEIVERFPILGTIADGVVAGFQKIVDIVSALAGAIVDADLGAKGKELIEGFWSGVTGAWDAGVSFFTDLGTTILDAIGDLASTLWQKGQDLIAGLARGYVELWTAEINFFINLGQTVFDAIGDVTSWLWQKGQDLIAGLYRGVKELWDREVAFWTGLGQTILSAIGDLLSILWQKGQDLIAGLKRGWSELWDREVAFWTNLGATIVGAIGSLLSTLYETGKGLIQGFINGVNSLWDTAINFVRSLVQGAIDAAWEAIKPGSPSREGFAIGESLIKGMIDGAGSLGGALKDKMVSLANEALEGLKSTVADAGGAILGPGVAPGGPLSLGTVSGGGSWVDQAINYAASRTGVPAALIAAIAATESQFGANQNGGTAFGLFQVEPRSHGGTAESWMGPEGAIRGANEMGSRWASAFAALGGMAAYQADPVGFYQRFQPAAQGSVGISRQQAEAAMAAARARGYAEGGTVKSGWGVVGEKGWERFHLGPQGLTIFPHEMSKAMGPMAGGRGYATGTVSTGPDRILMDFNRWVKEQTPTLERWTDYANNLTESLRRLAAGEIGRIAEDFSFLTMAADETVSVLNLMPPLLTNEIQPSLGEVTGDIGKMTTETGKLPPLIADHLLPVLSTTESRMDLVSGASGGMAKSLDTVGKTATTIAAGPFHDVDVAIQSLIDSFTKGTISAEDYDKAMQGLQATAAKIAKGAAGFPGGSAIGAIAGHAGGGRVRPGWFMSGERGFELGYLGPQGLSIFSNEQSKAMLGSMGTVPGYAGGTPNNTKAEQFAAAVASPGGWTPALASAWFEGMQQIVDGMAEETEIFRQLLSQMDRQKLSDEVKRFVEWVNQFGEAWLKELLKTQGPEAAFQAFHGRSGRSLDQPMTVVLQVDGREFARATAPHISTHMAATVSSTMGGY